MKTETESDVIIRYANGTKRQCSPESVPSVLQSEFPQGTICCGMVWERPEDAEDDAGETAIAVIEDANGVRCEQFDEVCFQ